MFCLLQSNGQQLLYREKIPIDFQGGSCKLLVGYAFRTSARSQCSGPDKKNRISKTDFQGKHTFPTWKIIYTSSLLCNKAYWKVLYSFFNNWRFIYCMFVFLFFWPNIQPFSFPQLGWRQLRSCQFCQSSLFFDGLPYKTKQIQLYFNLAIAGQREENYFCFLSNSIIYKVNESSFGQNLTWLNILYINAHGMQYRSNEKSTHRELQTCAHVSNFSQHK